jgi:hypothetical protein
MKRNLSCHAVQLDLFSLFQDELETGKAAQMRKHLGKCPNCAATWDDLNTVLETLKRVLPSPVMEEKSWERLQQKIRISRQARAKRYLTEIRLAFGLIVLLGGLSLVWLLKLNHQVLEAIKGIFSSWGIHLPWLTEGPLSFFIAPILFIVLCSLLTLLLSPLILRRQKQLGPWPEELQSNGDSWQKSLSSSLGIRDV